MESKIKILKPNELLESFMCFGSKRNNIFKKGYENFYIASLQDLTEISRPPVPPVKAKTHTLIFLRSGVLVMKVGFHSTKIHKNNCIIIPAGKVFSYSLENYNEGKKGKGFICGFSNDFLIGQIGSQDLFKSFEFLTVWGNPIIKLKNKSAKYLVQALARIREEYTTNGLQNKLIIQSYLIATLCDLNINYQPISNHKNKTAVTITNRFKELLHKNIKTQHLVSDYASMLNISPNHLNKTIKLITQKSPSVWIKESLINEAKVLLFQTDFSIQEIALQLGFSDQSYFTRIFKTQEGLTPIAYREMIDLS
ncbi:helix-turn-helix domain-containing protein [Algibacter pacificus]|uniref:helix-turn-helix domain-containing protein n=1 Tax=Algibacter pacificus TaxID=2599389 RepID=UPI0011CA6C72|nr:AraC family transcriptional regulator [Algibacter pacificus]